MPDNSYANFAPLSQLRDTGPYSSRNTSKGALIQETFRTFSSIKGEISLDKIRHYIFEENGLNKRTYHNRRMVWNRLRYRFLSINVEWVGGSLAKATQQGIDSAEFLSLAYLYYVLTDRITFDFVTGPLWSKWQSGVTNLNKMDFLIFLNELSEDAPEVSKWRETTRDRLAANTLSALRDFGVLQGFNIKHIQRLAVSAETVFHLLSVLWAEDKRGQAILDAPDWHMFLWTETDIVNAMSALAQKGWIRFERSGRTVILEMVRMAELHQ